MYAFKADTFERVGNTERGVEQGAEVYSMIPAGNDSVLIIGENGFMKILSVPIFNLEETFSLSSEQTVWQMTATKRPPVLGY